MTPTEAWAVVRPDGEIVLVCLPRWTIEEARQEARQAAEAMGIEYHIRRVRIEDVRE